MYLNKRLTVLLIVLIVIIAACGNAKSEEESAAPPTEITPVRLKILLSAAQIEYAGLYAAISQGYFEDEKIKVDLHFTVTVDAVNNLDIPQRVVAGEADFGVNPADRLLLRRQAGEGVVGLMTFYQRDSTAILSLTEKNITRPEDLAGRRLLRTFEGIQTDLLLQTVGLAPEDVVWVEPEGELGLSWIISTFLAGEVDAMVLPSDASAQLNAIGVDHNRLVFYEYGIQTYTNVLFTTPQMIADHSDVVQRFINALLRGMQFAIEQPATVVDWFVENFGDQLHPLQIEAQDEGMLAIIPLMETATSRPGTMNPDTWQYLYDGMVQLGVLDSTLKPTDAYTLEFLEAYYQ